MTDFGTWTLEYLELEQTRRKLKDFMRERYEEPLREIARVWVTTREHQITEPCHDCVVEVSTLIDPDKGWYFEWRCEGGYTGFGCTANGEAWHVPLTEIKAHLAQHGVT